MLWSVGWPGWFGGGGGGSRDACVGDLSQAASQPPTTTVNSRAIVRNRAMTKLLLMFVLHKRTNTTLDFHVGESLRSVMAFLWRLYGMTGSGVMEDRID
jgi:hypothetical protein